MDNNAQINRKMTYYNKACNSKISIIRLVIQAGKRIFSLDNLHPVVHAVVKIPNIFKFLIGQK